MAKKKYNLKLAVVKRFLRTYIPQLVIYMPIVIGYAEKMKEVMPLWVLPVLGFVASVTTAIDKLIRELKK